MGEELVKIFKTERSRVSASSVKGGRDDRNPADTSTPAGFVHLRTVPLAMAD